MRPRRHDAARGLATLVALGALAGALPEVVHAQPEAFVDVTTSVGVDFEHRNGMLGRYYFMEMMGSGGALLDFDDDGDLDLFLAQGPPPWAPDVVDADGGHRLYRNEIEPTGELRFVDVTGTSGLHSRGYAMGAGTGDYDGDGLIDLYVTAFGPNQLWHNVGGGRFEDVTGETAVRELHWSVPAVFVDLDADGRLDLFVGNYLEADLSNHRDCHLASAIPTYCSPTLYSPAPDRLLRNDGSSFVDVTRATGLHRASGPALGAAAADFDDDGRLDLYVANDQQPNLLWIAAEDGGFRNDALLAGVALSGEGRPEAGMGVTVGDFDGDARLDLFVAHLRGETSTLYRNLGSGTFADVTNAAGLGATSLPFTAFGASFFDLENDGDLDLLVVNGEVRTLEKQYRADDPLPLRQSNQLFVNDGEGRFREESGGAVFAVSEVSRAGLFGDVDNDGDTDVVVLNNHGRARVLVNRAADDSEWLGLRLVTGRRDALGASARLNGAHGTQVRRAATDGSYGAANDPRVLFGLGDEAASSYAVEVRWVGGRTEMFEGLKPGRYTTLTQGTGRGVEGR